MIKTPAPEPLMHGGPWSPPAALEPWHWPRCCCRAQRTVCEQFSGVIVPSLCSSCSLFAYTAYREPGQKWRGKEDMVQEFSYVLTCSPWGEPGVGSCLPHQLTWPGVLFNCNPLSFLNLLVESSSHFYLPYENVASVFLLMKSSCLQRSQRFDGFVCLNTDSSTYQESKHEIYTMCTPIAWKQFRLTERPNSFCNECEL